MDDPKQPAYVPWPVFIWASSIIVVILTTMLGWGISLNTALAKEKDARIAGDNTALIQQTEIVTELKSIEATLVELKADIKAIQ